MKALALSLLLLCPTAGAQQAMPVIGYLGAESPETYGSRVEAFRRGLADVGFVDGRNVVIEFRWARGDNSRLPGLASELAGQKVNVLTATGSAPASLAAKKATTTIPVVFEMGLDPVAIGLVETMNRPGGNATGVTSLNAQVHSKRLQLLREMVPGGKVFALLINPTNHLNSDTASRDVQAAARAGGLQLLIVNASTEQELPEVFRGLARQRVAGLVIANDTFFIHRSKELAALALRDRIPAVLQSREFVEAGGLMSYGANPAESHRLAGVYAGRILKGEKPGDLPVQQLTKLELFVNARTARTFGLTLPQAVRFRAEGVID